VDTAVDMGQSAVVRARSIPLVAIVVIATISSSGELSVSSHADEVATSPTTVAPDPAASTPPITVPVDLTPYPVRWTLDPASDPPDTSATLIPIVVRDNVRCNGGLSPEKRLLPPHITYSDATIGIAILATPPKGRQSCPASAPVFITVRLEEAVGDRRLVDTGSG
jgi:hypothetical protein